MKRNYWPLFFIGIFSLTFSMIIWTIVSSTKIQIVEDRSFMKKYQEVDAHFNDIMISNEIFTKKYDLEFYVNSKKFDLTTQDIMYSQRVLEKISKHKNLLKLGSNDVKIIVNNKQTKQKEEIKISLKFTKSNANTSDMILTNLDFKDENKQYNTTVEINEENNWNITGVFEVNGDKGYIYIKTNAS